MNGNPPAEGEIVVTLGRAGVSLANTRPLTLASRLAGLGADILPARLSALYSVCRHAQGIAAATAVEAALGLGLSPSQIAARRCLVLAETVTEHATRIILDWPLLAGANPDPRPLKTIRKALADLASVLYPAGDWARPGGGALVAAGTDVAGRIETARGALRDAGLIARSGETSRAGWLAQAAGPGTFLLRHLEERGLWDAGGTWTSFLDPADPAMLAARLASDPAFQATPEQDGHPCETGPLARRRHHPWIACKAGIGPRLLARLLDLAESLAEITALAPSLDRADPGPDRLPAGSGTGVGTVETARGFLLHRVVLDAGRVAGIRILAPTEWNFHPAGWLAKGLGRGADGIGPAALAALMVAALDPCVAWRLERRDA